MHRLQRHRRRVHGTMLLALVLAALAPVVSRALALTQAGRAPWSTVCSAERGTRPPVLPVSALASAVDHCAYCSLASDLPMVPAAPADPTTWDRAGDLRVAGRSPPPGQAPAWSGAQPRAPPPAG